MLHHTVSYRVEYTNVFVYTIVLSSFLPPSHAPSLIVAFGLFLNPVFFPNNTDTTDNHEKLRKTPDVYGGRPYNILTSYASVTGDVKPSRRQRSAPKADPPVRTSPLAPSVDTNASTSAKAKTAGGKAKAKAPKAKRPKPAVSTDGDGGGDGGGDEGGDGRGDGARGKKSKKRPRVGGGDGQVATAKAKGGGGGKKTPSSTSTKTSTSTKENRREVCIIQLWACIEHKSVAPCGRAGCGCCVI